MTRQIKAGTTDVSVVIRIIDSTDGTPETGVVFDTAGIDLEYRREGAASTDITEATLAALTTAHTDGGFLHIGNGYYRLDLPDAACATGATGVLVHGTVTGMVVIGEYIELVAYDPYDTVRLGLTALPNAAADAAGGLPISDAGGLDLDAKVGALTFTVANKVDANATHISGDSAAADNAELFFDGTGYAAANSTIGTVTTVTNGVNATSISGDSVAADNLEALLDGTGGVTLVASAITLTTPITANATQLSGDATAADNAEAFFDGTGYAGTGNTIPTVTTVNGLAAGVITAAAIATGAVDADALAADGVAEIADAVWDEARSGHVADGSFGQAAQVLRSATAQAGAAGSITLDASASAVDDFYKNALVVITAGTGVSQARTVSGYTGASKVATITPNWGTNPDATSEFVILPTGSIAGASAPTAGEVADAVWDEARSGHVSAGSFGEYTPANVTTWLGTAAATPTVAGVPEVDATHWNGTAVTTPPAVNVTQISGDSTAADNLEAALDGTGGVTLSVVLGTDAITAASMAAGSIDASALAADAVTEIWAGVTDSSGVTTLLSRLSATRAVSLDAISLRNATAQAGAGGTITLDASASATDDLYNGLWIIIESGTGAAQARLITDYVGSTKVATVAPNWTTNPSSDSVFALVPAAKISGVTLVDTVTTVTGLTASNLDATISSRASQTSVDTIDDLVDDLETRLTATRAGYLDNLSAGAVALQASVDDLEGRLTATRAGYLDNLSGGAVALAANLTGDPFVRLGAPVGASISADIAGVQSDTNDIQTRLPAALTAGGNMKSDALAVSGSTDAADRLERGALSTVLGTCDAGGSTTTVIASSLTATNENDQFIGRVIIFDTDTTTAGLRGQATTISDYVHSTKTFTVGTMTSTPASGDSFTVV